MTKQEEINDLKDCIASWRKERDELEPASGRAKFKRQL